MITVRKACADDLSTFLSIEETCFSVPLSPPMVRVQLEEDWGASFVAEEDGQTVGVLLGACACGVGEVSRLATLPAHRGRGVATALLSALLPLCHVKCTLEVRRGNAAARALYEKHGFLPVGERKNYYTAPVEDAILYERTEQRTKL